MKTDILRRTLAILVNYNYYVFHVVLIYSYDMCTDIIHA